MSVLGLRNAYGVVTTGAGGKFAAGKLGSHRELVLFVPQKELISLTDSSDYTDLSSTSEELRLI